MKNQLKAFIESICKDSDLKNTILSGYEVIFEGINASDIQQMAVPAYTNPISEKPMGSYANIIKTVPSSITSTGEVGDSGITNYKYGPADASPTRDIKEETNNENWKVKIPTIHIQKDNDVVSLIKKAQPHLPNGGSVGKDFGTNYNGLASPLTNRSIVYDTNLII